MKLSIYFVFSVILLVTTGCSTALKTKPFDGNLNAASQKILKGMSEDHGLKDHELSIQYLGVGGHLFRYGKDALMTSPSFTNPSLIALTPFLPLSADSEKIDQYLPPVDDVEIILVGHAHYDHLLDLPYIMNTHARSAHVYGSETTGHIMAAAIDKSRIHIVNDSMAQDKNPGQWIYSKSKRIRFMAIRSSHAPHVLGMKFMQGQYTEDLTSLPWSGFGWREGQTLSYLIDFLGDDGHVAHRVYYQDAASAPHQGLIPQLSEAVPKRIDIAIICPAAFQQEKDYPESIMRSTQAKHFILGHWEDFFGNDLSQPARWLRLTNEDEFFTRFKAALPADSTWTLPNVFAIHRFAEDGRLIKTATK